MKRNCLIVACVMALVSPMSAATNLWDGGVDGSWTNAANWADDLQFADGNDVEFVSTNAANLFTVLNSNLIVNTLIFNSNATSTVTISNNTMFLLGGMTFDPLSANHVISSTINLSNYNQTWFMNGQTLTVGAVNDVGDTVLTVSNGTVFLTAGGNVGQWNMVNGATLQQNAGTRIGDTSTSIALDSSSKWDLGYATEAFRGLSGSGLVTNYGAGNMSTRPQAGDRFVFSGTIDATNSGTGVSWVMEGLSTVGTQVFETTLPFESNIQILNGVGVLAGANGAAPDITNVINIGRAEVDTARTGTNAVLVLDSSVANHATQDRLPNSEAVFIRSSGELAMIGNSAADTTETISNLVVSVQSEARPRAVVTMDAGTGGGVQLAANALERTAVGGTILFRGDNLGTGPIGPGTALVTFATAPTLSGSGTLGTPQAGILPYAIGDNSLTGQGTDFVTYDANGIRLLSASEYTNALGLAGGGYNVELTSSPAALAGDTADLALKINGADVSVDLGGNQLTLSAGSIISGGFGTNALNNGRITFGNNAATGYEGFLFVNRDMYLGASITNNGANAVSLTKSGLGTLYLDAQQAYTGRTVIDQGTVFVNGTNYLGRGQLSLDGTLVLSNGVYQAIGMLAGAGSGNVIITNNATLEIVGGAGNRDYNGIISGPSSADLIKSGGNTETLFAGNPFAGEVFIQDAGTLQLSGGSGALGSVPTFYISRGGQLLLNNNNGTSQQNGTRIGNNSDFNMDTGILTMRGSRNQTVGETIDDINLRSGYNTFTLDAIDGGNDTTLSAAGSGGGDFVRQNRATALVRGDRLGEDLALGNNSQFKVNLGITNQLSDQSWSNKGPGSTSLPIIPWITGGTNESDTGSTFVTYTTNFGFRPLNQASEFVNQSFGTTGQSIDLGTASNNNFRVSYTGLSSNVTVADDMTVLGLSINNTNSANNNIQIADGKTLTVQNGMILSYGSQDNELVGGTLTFGTNGATGYEGRIHGVRPIDVRSVIANNFAGGVTNAVSLTTDGAINLRTNAAYTGQTTVNSGNLSVFGNNFLPDVLTRVNNGILTITAGVTQKVGMLVSPATANNGIVSNGANSVLEVSGVGGSQSYYGVIKGPNTADFIKSSSNTLSLLGASTNFLGDVIVRDTGTLRLIGATGSLAAARSITMERGGTLDLDNNVAAGTGNNNNRILDTATNYFNRGNLIVRASQDYRSDEAVGPMVFQGAYNTITLDADETATNALGEAGDVRLTAGDLIRQDKATGLVRGDRLGLDLATGIGTLSNGQSQLVLPSVSIGTNLLSHDSTTPGTTALGIIPWLTGGTNSGDGGSTFVTYDTTYGMRPLDLDAEFSNQIFAASGNVDLGVSNQNFRISQAVGTGGRTMTVADDLVVRGLLINNTNSASNNLRIDNGKTLRVESGLILSTGSQDNEITNGFLTFGPNAETGFEGRIHGVRRIDIRSQIVDMWDGAQSNAVSLTTDGTVYLMGSNLFSGETVINSGRIEISGADNRLPIGTALTVADGGELRLFGGSQQIGGLQGAGLVDNLNTTTARTLTISNESDYVFSGTFMNGNTGALHIVKQGNGMQTLTGTNMTTGILRIEDGTLFAVTPTAILSNYLSYGNITNTGGVLAIRGGGPGQWTAPDMQVVLSNAVFQSGTYFAVDVESGRTFSYGEAVSNGVGWSSIQSFVKTGSGTLNLNKSLSLPEDLITLGGTLNITNHAEDATARDVLVTNSTLNLATANVGFRDVRVERGGTYFMSNVVGQGTFRDATVFGGTATFDGANVTVDDAISIGLANAASLRFFADNNLISNATSIGGDIFFGLGATDNTRIYGDLTMLDGFTNKSQPVVRMSNGVVRVDGNFYADATYNTNNFAGSGFLLQPEFDMYAKTNIILGNVLFGPTNPGTPGSTILRVNNEDSDATIFGSNLVLNTASARTVGAQFTRGDVVVSNNIVVNAQGLDRRSFTNVVGQQSVSSSAARLDILAYNDLSTNDGVGLFDRLVEGTLAQGPDGIVVNAFGDLYIGMNRTNVITPTIAQKITINNGGPNYREDVDTLVIDGPTNRFQPGAVVGTMVVNLTNVWMNEGAHLRIDENGTDVRVGMILAGATSFVSEGTSSANDSFDLLNIRSSVGGSTLWIGSTDGVAEASFGTTLRGTSDSDVTLNVFNGTLTVSNGVGNVAGLARTFSPGTNINSQITLQSGGALAGISNITGRFEVGDWGRLLVQAPRTNAVITFGNEFRIANTGPNFYQATNAPIAVQQSGGAASGTIIFALTNVVLADGSYLRVQEANTDGREQAMVGLAVEGTGAGGTAYLGKGVGTTSDDFDLLDVRSSTAGQARTVQIGTTNAPGDTSFNTTIRGTASSDITLNVFNGNLTMTNGANIFGTAQVSRSPSLFDILPGTTGYVGQVLVEAGTFSNRGDVMAISNVAVSGGFAYLDGVDSLISNLNVSGGTALASAGQRVVEGGNITVSGGSYNLGGFGQTNSGIVAFLGGLTTNGTLVKSGAAYDAQAGIIEAILAGDAGLTKTGTGTVTLVGGSANTYTGLTTVTAGTLALNKTPGVNAIVGDGVGSKTSNDILVNGGTLLWLSSNQVDDSATITMTSGLMNLNGKKETLYEFHNLGGTFKSGRGGGLTVIDPTWGEGSTNWLEAGATDSYGNLIIAGGFNRVHGQEDYTSPATLTVGSGGLVFSNSTSPSLILNADHTAAGSLILGGDVSFVGSSGTASIASGPALLYDGENYSVDPDQTGLVRGFVDLNGGTRTFDIGNGASAVDMSVTANIVNLSNTVAGILKSGVGTLLLGGTNSYDGPTTVGAGTLLVNGDNTLAQGLVTVLGGGTLGGNGTIGGQAIFEAGATNTPGFFGPGVQTFANGIVFSNAAVFQWELTTNASALALRGSFFDGVDMTSNLLEIASGATMSLVFNRPDSSVNWNDAFWDTNQSWLVFDMIGSGATNGGTANFALDSSFLDSFGNDLATARPGWGFFTSFDGNGDLYLNYAIPEPGTWALLLVGLGAIGYLRRRRKG